jgi:hypothetical protein
MALNRLQKALINSHIGPRASGLNCQKKLGTHTFFNTSDRNVYSKKTVYISQVYTYVPKIQKKS